MVRTGKGVLGSNALAAVSGEAPAVRAFYSTIASHRRKRHNEASVDPQLA